MAQLKSGTRVYGNATVDNQLTVSTLGVGTSSLASGYEVDVVGDIRATGNLFVSASNAQGGGIILSDDGDIVDLNDGFASLRFSNGVRVYSTNKGGSTAITLGSNGQITSSSDITLGGELNFGTPSSNKFIDFYTRDASLNNYAANFRLVNHDSSAFLIGMRMLYAGAVELYHNNTKTFETSSTGATVTGTLLATALSTGAVGTGININNSGTITGPATITIDPAAIGDDTGTVEIKGNLTVQGTTTTINSTTSVIADPVIELRRGNSITAADGGIQVNLTTNGSGVVQTFQRIQWNNTSTRWETTDGTTAKPIVNTVDAQTIAGNTTFSANLTASGSNAAIQFSPTGTGSVTINPATAGTINNMSIGATTASTGRFTTLNVKDTSANFDVVFSPASSTALTANRTLAFDVTNANRTIKLAGNVDLANNFTTSGNFALTLTTTAATNVTLPTSGTLATTGNLSQFASTTSAQLAGVISDETGSGALVFAESPTLFGPTVHHLNVGGIKTGTYAHNGTTTITVTVPQNHGLRTGDSVFLDFTSLATGTVQPSDAYFNQVTAVNSTTFTVTAPAQTAATGNVAVYPENQIRFQAQFGDGDTSTNAYNHTVISERLYGAVDRSELLIFKGNDSGTTIQDNIRLAATGDIYFHTGFAGGGTVYNNYINSHGNTVASSNVSILASGNVGIGSVTPPVRLYVSNGNSTYTHPEDNNLPTIFARNTSNASTSAHAILSARVGGGLGGDPFVAFDIAGVLGWSIGIDNSDGDRFKISKSWTDLGSNNYLSIGTDGALNIFPESSAGSPANLDAQQLLVISRFSGALSNLTYSGSDGRLLAATITPSNEIVWRSTKLGLVATDYVMFAPGSSEKVRIKSDGNFGINTTDPQTKLDVNGNARIGNAGARSTSGLTVGFVNNQTFAQNSDHGDGARMLSIVNDSTTTNAMSILGFRINPNSGTQNAMLDMKFVQTGGISTSALYYTFNHNNNFVDRVRILSSGEVTINGTVDAQNLEVYELDDISTAVDGLENTFVPTFNYDRVSITDPFRLLITINGIIQSCFAFNRDYVFNTLCLASKNGYTIDQDGNIKFTESLPMGSEVIVRSNPGSTRSTFKYYPFSPLDLMLSN